MLADLSPEILLKLFHEILVENPELLEAFLEFSSNMQ